MPRHHAVFHEFVPFKGAVPPGLQVSDFLGSKTRVSFVSGLITKLGLTVQHADYVEAGYPPFNEDYFLWVDLLEAVLAAKDRLTVVELGAGYGEWLMRAYLAGSQRRPKLPIMLIGVEAEPTHFEWMRQHFLDNGVNPDEHELIQAAVDDKDGMVDFYVGDPDGWYGQAIARAGTRMADAPTKLIPAVSLSTVLKSVSRVDLLHLDIQGAELAVVESSINDLNAKVARVHIGTHARDLECRLRDVFWAAEWHKANDYPGNSVELTPWGEMTFVDGVQTWINPRLSDIEPTIEQQQWMLRRSDAREVAFQADHDKLQADVEKPA